MFGITKKVKILSKKVFLLIIERSAEELKIKRGNVSIVGLNINETINRINQSRNLLENSPSEESYLLGSHQYDIDSMNINTPNEHNKSISFSKVISKSNFESESYSGINLKIR